MRIDKKHLMNIVYKKDKIKMYIFPTEIKHQIIGNVTNVIMNLNVG